MFIQVNSDTTCVETTLMLTHLDTKYNIILTYFKIQNTIKTIETVVFDTETVVLVIQ